MDYATLVELYTKLDSTTKRLAKIKYLADFIGTIPAAEIEQVVLLLQGRVFPAWDDRKIGIASRLVLKSLHTATGTDVSSIEEAWKKTGDLGDAAAQLIEKKQQATLFSEALSVGKVVTNLQKLSTLGGHGTVAKKLQLIAELLTSAKPEEAKYIIRTLLEDLRVGVGEGNFRDAITWSFFGEGLVRYDAKMHDIEVEDREEYKKVVGVVQRGYDLTNDFAEVIAEAKKGGLKGIQALRITIGKPLKVMLALKVDGIEEGFERCGKRSAIEYKLDGFRIQVHVDGKQITLFTRRLENVTAQFPDVVEHVAKYAAGKKFIIDGEVVGFDVKTKKYLPFQMISQRIRRKYDIASMAKLFPVELNVFDVLFFEGTSMIDTPFVERRALLEKMVTAANRKMVLVKQLITDDPQMAKNFYNESLELGNEGVMFKKLNAPYKPGARVGNMVKVKPVMDTLDLVIVGAEWGEGKRSAWLSSFTLACRDSDSFHEIGKMGTGIKEKGSDGVTFKQLTDELKPLIISEDGKGVTVKPSIVVEVSYEEIQKSPTYGSGFALRFPRLLNLRSDRDPKDCSTLELVKQYFAGQ